MKNNGEDTPLFYIASTNTGSVYIFGVYLPTYYKEKN